MKKKTMIALTAGGVCIIAALAIVLGVLLKSGKSPLPVANQNFLSGTTVNGVDVSGLDAEGAAAALAERADSYSFTLKLGDGSYTATGKDLGMSYNQSTDLQALLDQQKDNKEQLTFTLDNLYQSDVTGFIGQVEEQYNAQVA